jgi:hypothetical protein
MCKHSSYRCVVGANIDTVRGVWSMEDEKLRAQMGGNTQGCYWIALWFELQMESVGGYFVSMIALLQSVVRRRVLYGLSSFKRS